MDRLPPAALRDLVVLVHAATTDAPAAGSATSRATASALTSFLRTAHTPVHVAFLSELVFLLEEAALDPARFPTSAEDLRLREALFPSSAFRMTFLPREPGSVALVRLERVPRAVVADPVWRLGDPSTRSRPRAPLGRMRVTKLVYEHEGLWHLQIREGGRVLFAEGPAPDVHARHAPAAPHARRARLPADRCDPLLARVLDAARTLSPSLDAGPISTLHFGEDAIAVSQSFGPGALASPALKRLVDELVCIASELRGGPPFPLPSSTTARPAQRHDQLVAQLARRPPIHKLERAIAALGALWDPRLRGCFGDRDRGPVPPTEPAVRSVADHHADPRANVRRAVMVALQNAAPHADAAAAAIAAGLADPEPVVRIAAARAAATLRLGARLAAPLLGRLEDPVWTVRWHAARALEPTAWRAEAEKALHASTPRPDGAAYDDWRSCLAAFES